MPIGQQVRDQAVRVAQQPSWTGWRCAIEDNCLTVTTVGVPEGTEWQVELIDERWSAPLVSTSEDEWLSVQLPPSVRGLEIRACLSSTGWTSWTKVNGSIDLSAPASDELRAVFEQCDRNKSGLLDYRELRGALKYITGLDPSFDVAAKLLSEYDSNNNGLMEFEEFSGLIGALRTAQLEALQGLINTLRTEITALSAQLGTKDSEIASLKTALAAQGEKSDELRRNLGQKDNELSALRAELVELRRQQRPTYEYRPCLLYTSPSPRDRQKSRMPSSA